VRMRLLGYTTIIVAFVNAYAVTTQRWARKMLGTAGLCFSLGSSPVLAKVNDPNAIERWQSAYKELQNLDKNWDMIVNDNRSGTNGDNIRRKLGTVYTPPNCDSPLCSFSSFVNRFVKVRLCGCVRLS
jgi:hypothetical protein